MSKTLEVLFTPADFVALKRRDLSQTTCVVFDILRATSSMITALANGAEAIIPVSEISEAVAIRKKQARVLLAGERDGLRIRAAQTGSIDFDLGNSPREFTPDKVRGKTIAMTTTNGTRALQACAGAKNVFIGSFLNLQTVAAWMQKNKPGELLLVCAGTYEEAAYEDTLACGALVDLLWPDYESGNISDSAQVARQIFLMTNGNLMSAMQFSRNARRLLSIPELKDDVWYCMQRDTLGIVAWLQDARIQTAGIP